jgi:hypothetical protein
MTRSACKLAPVVVRPSCSVSVCNHGLLHVTIGPVTLHIASNALEPILETLTEARAALQQANAATQDCH